MAHTNQQRKRIRQTAKANTAHTARRSRVATMVKKLESALGKASPEHVMDAMRNAMSELAKAARKGSITKGAAARKTSRLTQKVKKQAAK